MLLNGQMRRKQTSVISRDLNKVGKMKVNRYTDVSNVIMHRTSKTAKFGKRAMVFA